ncbi:uncharacterized protein LOC120351665 [Nilaparvata lugens]|uniref:uncharacterized protein LOC120351665 n=1 Tax=Nilaparvata lugens TaxID=108931 RepID=UPI00193CFC31|nr:uncharacterized protein LOC120351665 [Nilaparvata lugens]
MDAGSSSQQPPDRARSAAVIKSCGHQSAVRTAQVRSHLFVERGRRTPISFALRLCHCYSYCTLTETMKNSTKTEKQSSVSLSADKKHARYPPKCRQRVASGYLPLADPRLLR